MVLYDEVGLALSAVIDRLSPAERSTTRSGGILKG
jgi:hypothetical protein